MKRKYHFLKVKIDLLHRKSLFLSKTNQYNDYYRDLRDSRAGEHKQRPALIIKEFPNDYFLLSFATNAKFKRRNKHKGTFKMTIGKEDYHFNPTDSYIFSRALLEKNASNILGQANNEQLVNQLYKEAMRVGQIANKSNPHLLSKIADALLIEDYKSADYLITLQFKKITSKDISDRIKTIKDHKQYMKLKLSRKKKNH